MYCIVIGVLTTPWAYQFSACPVLIIIIKHIATDANLILLFKPALYSSTLEIELFESSIKLFYAEILTATL